MKVVEEEQRKERGIKIAKTLGIKRSEDGWIVPSQNGNGEYIVSSRNYESKCTCPDFEFRKEKCKHVFAVEFTLRQEIQIGKMKATKEIKVTYAQDWANYDKASINQKALFLELLADLVRNIKEDEYKFGRPKISKQDLVFSSVLKVYTTFSLRRFMTDLETAKEKGYVNSKPSYSSISHFMNKKDLEPVLRELVKISSLPLKTIETKFAIDSSGFSTSRFARYFSFKHQRDIRHRKWVNAHLICGTKTNVVTDIIVTKERKGDNKFLPELVLNTAKNFDMKIVTADMGYIGRANSNLIESVGALPFIPFSKNVKLNTQAKGSFMWKRMYHYFMFNNEEFMKIYHSRSNIETTYHMIKSKFGDAVRSKDEVAQINEVLCKVICHNICCVISESFELGISREFGK